MSGDLGAVVYVKDLTVMVSFYTGVFDAVAHQSSDDFVLLTLGDTAVTLVRMPPEIASTVSISSPPERRIDTPIKLSFAVGSIDAARLSASAHGGHIDSPDTEFTFGTVRVCDGYDPEGNVVQVREPA